MNHAHTNKSSPCIAFSTLSLVQEQGYVGRVLQPGANFLASFRLTAEWRAKNRAGRKITVEISKTLKSKDQIGY